MREQFAEFYELESFKDEMGFLIQYAELAPSFHSVRACHFQILDCGVEVLVGASDDREPLLSAGAAIANFRVAAAHFGYETAVLYAPRGEESASVAVISVRETCAPSEKLARLFKAIGKRHTYCGQFNGEPIEPEALTALCDVIDAWPQTFRIVVDRKLRGSASMLVRVSSDEDRVSLVQAGEAVETLLLTTTRLGLHYAFLSEPMGTPDQLLLLIGRSGSDRDQPVQLADVRHV